MLQQTTSALAVQLPPFESPPPSDSNQATDMTTASSSPQAATPTFTGTSALDFKLPPFSYTLSGMGSASLSTASPLMGTAGHLLSLPTFPWHSERRQPTYGSYTGIGLPLTVRSCNTTKLFAESKQDIVSQSVIYKLHPFFPISSIPEMLLCSMFNV